MNGPANIDSWFEFVFWALVAVGGLATSVAAVIAARHGRETRNQVANDHSTNFRDDVDRIDEKVDQVDTKVDRLAGNFDVLTRQIEWFMRESREATARQDRIAARHHPEDMR